MKQEGRVVLINEQRGFVAVEIESGEVSVVELLGCERVELSDQIVGYLDEAGGQSLYNETRDEELSAYIHESGWTFEEAQDAYFSTSTHMNKYVQHQSKEDGQLQEQGSW